MLISQTAEYALRAAVHLAAHSTEPQTNQQIASATHVPAGYLSKVLQTLGKKGLVQAQRGLRGGFTLTRSSEEITAPDIVNAVDPIMRIIECPLGFKEHGRNLCPLHRKLDDAAATVEQALQSTTLGAILREPGKSRPLDRGTSMEGEGANGNVSEFCTTNALCCAK